MDIKANYNFFFKKIQNKFILIGRVKKLGFFNFWQKEKIEVFKIKNFNKENSIMIQIIKKTRKIIIEEMLS